MYHIKDDRRAIQSSQMLYEALASLMREKPFKQITVTDLVERAQIGRSTFYRNFDELEDILWWRCDQAFSEMVAYVIDYLRQHPEEVAQLPFRPLLRFFDGKSEIIELLMLANRVDIIEQSFERGLAPYKPLIAARQQVAEEYIDYSIGIRFSIMTSILTRWVKNGKKQQPDELADVVRYMLRNFVPIATVME